MCQQFLKKKKKLFFFLFNKNNKNNIMKMKTKVWECFNNSTHTTCHKIKQLYLTEEIKKKLKKKKIMLSIHTYLIRLLTTLP